MSGGLAQKASPENEPESKAKTLGEIVTETNLKYAGKKQCDVKSAWLPVGEQEKWVREKLLVAAQQQLDKAETDAKDWENIADSRFSEIQTLEGRLQRIREHTQKLISYLARTHGISREDILIHMKAWQIELLAVVQGEGDTK